MLEYIVNIFELQRFKICLGDFEYIVCFCQEGEKNKVWNLVVLVLVKLFLLRLGQFDQFQEVSMVFGYRSSLLNVIFIGYCLRVGEGVKEVIDFEQI